MELPERRWNTERQRWEYPPYEWRIEYDNDTGPNDDSFEEWWTVTNGDMAFRCKKKEDAEWLLPILEQEDRRLG